MADETYYQGAPADNAGTFEQIETTEEIKSHVMMTEMSISELPDVIMSEDGNKTIENTQKEDEMNVIVGEEQMLMAIDNIVEQNENQQEHSSSTLVDENVISIAQVIEESGGGDIPEDGQIMAIVDPDVDQSENQMENQTILVEDGVSSAAMTSQVTYSTSEPIEAAIAPVFKICKVIRLSDGTTQCVETNMREIAVADRAVVYRAMLEKFPDIVKQKVASVLTPYQLKKIQATHDPNETSTEIEPVPPPPPTTTPVSNNYPKLISILKPTATTSTPQSTSLSISTDVTETVTEPPQKVAKNNNNTTKKGSIVSRYRKIAPKPLWSPPADIATPQAPGLNASKTPSSETTTHVCKTERYFECGGCLSHFKTELEFLKHAAINYLKVSPHLFASNCTIECILCEGQSVQLQDLMEAREHLRQHGNSMTTKCEICLQHVARDHMYATKTDIDGGVMVDGIKYMKDASFQLPQDENLIDNQIEGDVDDGEKRVESQTGDVDADSGPKTYKCRYCDKQFSKRNMCKMHVFAHLGIRPISCPLCGMSFHRKHSLSHHMQVHMQVKSKKDAVDSIPEMTDNTTNLPENAEMIAVDGDAERSALILLQSKNCRRKTTDDKKAIGGKNKSIKSDSVGVHKYQGPVLCELCGLELKNSRRLNFHQYRVHNQPRKRPISKDTTPLPCEECGKLCRGISALKSHQRMLCGKKEVLCEICGKMYPAGGRALSNHRYQTHRWRGSEMEKASWERTKKKNNDGESGKDNGEGSLEVNASNGESKPKKPFEPKKCELCGFVATYSTSMRAHLVNKHKYPKIRARIYNAEPVKCEKCGTICKGLPALKLHEIRFCLGGKTLTCPICAKTFQDRKKYSSHKYNHKWWGSEKERKWRERRKALGIPRKKVQKEIVIAPPEIEANLDEQEIQIGLEENVTTGTMEEVVDGIEEETAATEETSGETNLIIDSNSPLLQLISANHGLDPNSVQFVMEAAEGGEEGGVQLDHELELAASGDGNVENGFESDNSQVVNFYHILVTNNNGQNVYTLVPNVTEAL